MSRIAPQFMLKRKVSMTKQNNINNQTRCITLEAQKERIVSHKLARFLAKFVAPTPILGVVLVLLSAGCAQNLPIKDSQSAAQSPEAAAFIAKTTVVDPPSFLPISEARLLDARKDLNARERVIEDEIIAKFGLKVASTTIAGVQVLIISPRKVTPEYENAIAFHIHGGAFFLGTARERMALLLAARMGIRVYSVEYALSPEVKYPVAINQCLGVYRSLVKQFSASRIVATSLSAGGEIMLLMLQKAEHEGVALPKAQALVSPATDLSLTGDSKSFNDGRDILPVNLMNRIVGNFYLGAVDRKQSAASPLYGNFSSDFPPSVIVTGTRDFLMSDSVHLHSKLMSTGIKTELIVGEGMWHGFPIDYEVPESIATMNQVVQFLSNELHAESTAGALSQ
jgi:epsilon-lactone hydrolase